MQCRAPAGGWRRPAPSEKRGDRSSAGRGRELPARRRGRGRPPRAVASRRRRPARLLPAAQSASSEASAGGGAGAAAARVLAACLAEGRAPPAPGGRELFLRAPARSLRASLHPGGARVRPRAARTKSAAGTQRAGPCRPWPWSPCRRGRGRGRRLVGPLCRGVASGLSPPPERGCPLGYPPRRLGPGCFGGGRAEVIPRAGHILSVCAGALRGPRGTYAWGRALDAWSGVPLCPGRLETNGCRGRGQARPRRKAASCPLGAKGAR